MSLLTHIQNLIRTESDSVVRDSVGEDATIKVELTNTRDAAYTGNLLFGDQKKSMELLFDTGSPWLWVPLEECTTCHPKNGKYTPADSYSESNSNANATYVLGDFAEGTIATDEVRINADDDAFKMKIIGVKREGGMEDLNVVADGILGLAPSAHKGTDLFVNKLKSSGLISKAMFGLDLLPEGQVSEIIFGGYDTQKVPDEDKIGWLNLHNTDSWWTEFRHVNYDDKHVTSKGGLVVFDSGTSITSMSENILLSMISNFYRNGDVCELRPFNGETLWHCPCNSPSDFEKIGISMNGWEVFLDPATMIKDTGVTG